MSRWSRLVLVNSPSPKPVFEFLKELALGGAVGIGAGLLLAYAVASTARAGIWDESPGVAILAVVATLVLQATTAGYIARWLDLIEEPQAPG